ncbi:MAG: lysoplasmalogenase [Cyclobacteriaceae bacterium]
MRIFFAFAFFIAAIIELTAHLFGTGLNAYSKPLLMPLLLIYFLVSYQHKFDRRALMVTLALLLSCAGDVSLMGQGTASFIAGLSCFLFAHIAYIFIFMRSEETESFYFRLSWKLIAPMLGYIIALMMFLLPGSGPMMVPIIIYGLTILMMWYTASLRFGIRSPYQNWQIIIGATFFVLSDSMIGLNRFYTELAQSGFLIMSTYIGGQFLIINGLLGYFQEPARLTGIKAQST